MSENYKFGHIYTDKGGSSKVEDQFLRWVNIPGSGMGNSEGIRALNYVNKDSNSLPAYFILVSHDIKRTGNPWQDNVDFNTSTIFYWGDAKFNSEKTYSSFKGNKRLLQMWEAILDDNRLEIPPILHFSKPKLGIVRFNGLCVLNDLSISWFEEEGKPVKNYRAELTILDCEEVDVGWLHDRALNEDSKTLVKSTPKVWRDYIKGNTRKLDLWKKDILSKEEQLPEIGNSNTNILKELRALTPTQFEAVVVELFRNLPHVNHKIVRTQPTVDGGFDFYGQFTIPYPVKYVIEFLGEAKKYARDNAVQPKHVSRLVARLNRGQFGIFITTSYYTRQTQREVLEDGYPVKLFSGNDLVNFLMELRLVEGSIIKKDWLKSIVNKI